jgi:hypothetical protein
MRTAAGIAQVKDADASNPAVMAERVALEQTALEQLRFWIGLNSFARIIEQHRLERAARELVQFEQRHGIE